MIGDGIENCLQYVNNFDPEKSKNPFSYFTQIIYYAFIRRIQKEKKQTHTKHKIIEKNMMPTFDQNPLDDNNYGNQYMDYLQKNMLPQDGQEVYKANSSKKKETKKSLENFYEEK
jgi:DNA-directed RNA polymerase specialized sigma24 family protein